MKKVLLFAGLSLMMTIFSCKKKDEIPAPIDIPTQFEVSGNIETTTWKTGNRYVLKGTCFVQAGQILTIEPGTIIVGNKASKGTLVINEGGKLMAEGTVDKPIVFTSEFEAGARDKGDWGGIIILGKANCNQNRPAIEGISPAVNYGTLNSTANDGESSGSLKYVRVEYAGIALSPNNETNSITFGAIGSGTTVENVQVSFGGDDAFEWFGGTVNAKNLISLGTYDDDFDCDLGFTGKVQFALAIRDAFAADISGSNGFEVDNDAGGTSATPKTAPIFSNVTIYGPITDVSKAISEHNKHAMHLRRNSAPTIRNSVFTGFPLGLNIDGSGSEGNFNNGISSLQNNIMLFSKYDNSKSVIEYKDANDETYWTDAARNNKTYSVSTNDDLNSKISTIGFNKAVLHGSGYPSNPSFAVTSGEITTLGTNFTGLDSFFQNVSFRGAFGSTDWTDGWAEFSPQTKEYK